MLNAGVPAEKRTTPEVGVLPAARLRRAVPTRGRRSRACASPSPWGYPPRWVARRLRAVRASPPAQNRGDGSGNADLRSAPLREAQRNRESQRGGTRRDRVATRAESLIGKNRGQVRERRPPVGTAARSAAKSRIATRAASRGRLGERRPPVGTAARSAAKSRIATRAASRGRLGERRPPVGTAARSAAKSRIADPRSITGTAWGTPTSGRHRCAKRSETTYSRPGRITGTAWGTPTSGRHRCAKRSEIAHRHPSRIAGTAWGTPTSGPSHGQYNSLIDRPVTRDPQISVSR